MCAYASISAQAHAEPADFNAFSALIYHGKNVINAVVLKCYTSFFGFSTCALHSDNKNETLY